MKATVAKTDQDDIEVVRTKKHPLFNATPQQIDNWIDNNVNNLQDARNVLKLLAKAIRYVERNQL